METKQRKKAVRQRKAPVKRSRPDTAPGYKTAAPDVVYSPAKPFNRGQLLLRLITIVAVVLAITFGISIFFKVEVITVSGAEKYSEWMIREASGIQEGENLLTFGKAKACGQIKAQLPYVNTVRIGIELPNRVNIEITEHDVVYAIRETNGAWWLMTSDGKIVEQVNSAEADNYTQLLGITLKKPGAGKQAVAVDPEPEIDADGNELPITVLGSDRLAAMTNILQCMEKYSIIGEVTSVNVADIGKLEIWYGQQYQVELGDTTRLDEKIYMMKETVKALPDYESGVIDVSFKVIPDGPMYTSFS